MKLSRIESGKEQGGAGVNGNGNVVRASDDDATDELEDVVLVAGAAADDVGELPEVRDVVVELDDFGVNQTNGSSYSVVVEDVVAGVVEATEMVELD